MQQNNAWMISGHYLIKSFHHENTKFKKAEIKAVCFSSFRALVIDLFFLVLP